MLLYQRDSELVFVGNLVSRTSNSIQTIYKSAEKLLKQVNFLNVAANT